jgi:dipeptidyl aminopeptidase/acylaminoacyl peptidase
MNFPPHRLLRCAILFPLLISAVALADQGSAKHLLGVDDFPRFKVVEDPQCSPDGNWIAHTVRDSDLQKDQRRSSIWMVGWDGKQQLRLTYGDSDESPRWSPDGESLAFLSTRAGSDNPQIWLLDRRGGEARQLTRVKGQIQDYQWSPDGKRMVLVMSEKADTDAAPQPIVIDRFQIKEDVSGYLTAASRSHLYLFDIASQTLEALTSNPDFADGHPAWSPDGSKIAYVSNHARDPDMSGTKDIFLIDPHAGARPEKLLTANAANDQRLLWSPDGRSIAFLVGQEPRYYAYLQDRLAVVPVQGGTPRVLTASLDRTAVAPEFSADGKYLIFMVPDDLVQYPARIPVAGGKVERLLTGDLSVTEQCHAGNHTAIVLSTDDSPPEIYALEGKKARKLGNHNDDLMSQLRLGAVENLSAPGKDGPDVHGLIVKPPDFEAGKKYPAILWIHGGPLMQDDHSLPVDLYALQLERQYFAAHGYVVLAVNYRGSDGRGMAYAQSIYADWGNKEVDDLLAAVDEVVRMGIADPDRLGIGGWSYGGILTDSTIARDTRFKAAASGAGSANQLAMYGADQYAMQYTLEIGPPWSSLDTWLKVSHAFFHADQIETPTLFLGGEKDFNVPIAGGEQMYLALRTLGVPTELVVYPGQYHIFTRPSFIRDRLERWLAWFDQYLKQAE